MITANAWLEIQWYMFGGLIVFMLIGYPVAFSLAAVGLFCGFIDSAISSS